MLDFSKYENATPKQNIHALTLAEKRAEKLAVQMRENEELFKFLQKKLKKSFSIKKVKQEQRRIPELDEAIRQFENGEYESYDNIEEAIKALNAE